MKWLNRLDKRFLFTAFIFLLTLSTQMVMAQKGDKPKQVDTTSIANIMGMKGKSNNGEYKITIPQNDLNVMVDGFKIILQWD